ncbi:MAG: argininosuccinate synthase [Xanthomonadales bacterium]|nr:argininosuccinate synthase [Xanthomonadales bacterium]
MSENKPICVLAFSGGLDTSYCVLVLKEQGFDVHTVFVTTGGMDPAEVTAIEARALELGATKHITLDAAQDIWDEFVVPLTWSQARMRGEYPMLCSDRYVIVRKSLEYCDQLGTKYFAHGCTGMGNDQLRFDQTVRSLGDYQLLAPIRELQAQTSNVRDYEMDKLKQAGFAVSTTHSKYSINENLLGVTISGQEIDEFETPAEDTYVWCRPRAEWPTETLSIKLGFEKGEAISINGERLAGPEIIKKLNRSLGEYGVGRHIYTGDVTIGLKGRIVFECPGIDALLIAHQALEDCVNTRWQNSFRQTVSDRWADLVYTGFFYEPHKADLEAYLKSSQAYVSGEVELQTSGGILHATAVDSEWMLRDKDAVYAQSCSWSPQEAEGFIKLIGQSSTLAAKIRK